ncbi:MAG: hypothetical protein J6T56_05660 [Bacteroidales bacterium]|nr:hypothetical protein [Bacteroidales bacterium]
MGVLTIHTANTPRKYKFEKTDKYETWFPNNFLNTASNEERYISELKNRLEVDEVALVLPIRRFEGTAQKIGSKIGPKIGPKTGPKKLSPQERLDMIIAIIKDNPLITREGLADIIGVGHTTIQNDMRILKEQYGLRYEGSSKTGQWVIDKQPTQ